MPRYSPDLLRLSWTHAKTCNLSIITEWRSKIQCESALICVVSHTIHMPTGVSHLVRLLGYSENVAEGGAMSAVTSDDRDFFETPLNRLLGTRTANSLKKLGLETARDLLNHAPRRLSHRGQLMPLSSLTDGESVTVVARVLTSTLRPMNARRGFLLSVRIADSIHEMDLTFFGKNRRPLAYHENQLAPGVLATFSGTVSSYRGKLQLTHPEYQVVEREDDVDADDIARPIPIYPAGVKVPTWTIAKAVDTLLSTLTESDVPEILPDTYRQTHGLMTRYDAIKALHQPRTDDEYYAARTTLKHHEAFCLQTVLARRHDESTRINSQPRPRVPGRLHDAFDNMLPFDLTDGQKAVGDVIATDLASDTPMTRLLQGDVGSGKTIVALRAMTQVVDSGGQAVLLAPTEVLAEQHFASISSMLGPLGLGGTLGAPEHATRVDLLTGSMPQSQKRQVLARLASGETGIIIGTHALLSDTVQIPFLSLAVVDEQHRFGVDQRDAIRGSDGVNLLVMTATPIPRTLAMTVFGDLDVSELTELPAGRAPISTTIVPTGKQAWVDRVWQRAAEEVRSGGRVYVVCPRIAARDGEDDTLTNVEDTRQYLEDLTELSGIKVTELTGPMSTDEKQAAMEAFRDGSAPIMVATTVIEVGVDVPEATMMIIMDADRFGLSQLHQLRGRIGRGTRPGLCLALTSSEPDTVAGQRLDAFAATTNGFVLAEKDLELRREGNILGAHQSGGLSALSYLSVTADSQIITDASRGARELIDDDPQLDTCTGLLAEVRRLEALSQTDYLGRN